MLISEIKGSFNFSQVIKGIPYSFSADIWSLGVILYALLSGLLPFVGSTNEKIFQAVKRGHLDFSCPTWNTVSQEAKDLICQMLNQDPSKRPSAQEIMADPWIMKQTGFVPMHVAESTSLSSEDESTPEESGVASTSKWRFKSVFQRSSNSAKNQLSCLDTSESCLPFEGSTPTSTLDQELSSNCSSEGGSPISSPPHRSFKSKISGGRRSLGNESNKKNSGWTLGIKSKVMSSGRKTEAH